MVWIQNINELEYYNPSGAPEGCYHEMLFAPNDLLLQAPIISQAVNNSYDIHIYALSLDGLTNYGEITDHFLYFFFGVNIMLNGYIVLQPYCNLKMNTVPEELCEHNCFILQVVIQDATLGSVLFDRYTQAYEIDPAMCCVPITDITVTQDTDVIGGPCSLQGEPEVAVNPCGKNWIRVSSTYPCLDSSNWEFYGRPTSIWTGGNTGPAIFSYSYRGWIEAIIRENPRQIKRTIAFNCSIQKVEHTRMYQFQGTRTFPDWKKIELEGVFKSPEIYIGNGNGYIWRGGTMFERCVKRYQFFKLDMTLEECEKRQIFGCGDTCEPDKVVYLAMKSLPSNGRFFNDNRELVAEDIDGFMLYLGTLNGVSAESVVPDEEDMLCTFEKVIEITGPAPTMYYAGYPNQANRIYTMSIGSDEEGNPMYNQLCNGRIDKFSPTRKAVLSEPVILEVTVPPAVLSAPVIEDMTATKATITTPDGWDILPITDCTVIGNEVTFSISVKNATYNDPRDPYEFSVEHIATIAAIGRPSSDIIVDSTTNALFPSDKQLRIATDGKVYWNGTGITQDATGATIEFYNIKYTKD